MFGINILSCVSIDTPEIGEVVIEDETNDMVSIMEKLDHSRSFAHDVGVFYNEDKNY